ncbi:hypothetical protein WJX72_003808 [[Myrmecia] bisecta]|uniref:Uncharacterized protein n=1 Tax=[Myrmecia] bisecta TaxID=41462 RepID=A0AAW1PKM4_9CHLO
MQTATDFSLPKSTVQKLVRDSLSPDARVSPDCVQAISSSRPVLTQPGADETDSIQKTVRLRNQDAAGFIHKTALKTSAESL